MPQAQGEDIVAGTKTPLQIHHLLNQNQTVYNLLCKTLIYLENKYKHMQEVEFTIENGHLFLLQSRNGKCTHFANVNITSSLLEEGKISKQEALERIDKEILNQLSHTIFEKQEEESAILLANGLAACTRCVSGKIAFSNQSAVKFRENGEKCILVRNETSPEDLEGMNASVDIITVLGGLTSHAAVVARSMEKACIVGCSQIKIENNTVKFTHITLKEGDLISMNGENGNIYLGELKITNQQLPNALKNLFI